MSKNRKAFEQRPQIGRRQFLRGGVSLGVGVAAPLHSSRARGRQRADLSAPDDLIWGVNGHPVTAYPGVPLNDQLGLVRDLGFTHYRINLRGDGSPDYLEDILRAADSWDVTILPILIGAELDLDKTAVNEIKAANFEIGKSMAARFKGRVPIWELGNELENYAIIHPCEIRDDGTQYPCEWGPAGGVGALEYFGPRWAKVSAVLSGLAEGVAAADKKALRAMGTAGFGHLGAFERMKNDGIPWEITVWHDYETIRESYLETLKDYGRPIWVTEFNAGGGGDQSHEENARQLVERIGYYRKMRTDYNVTAAFPYELLDEPYWGDHFEARMGLVSLKPHPEHENGWTIDALKPQGVGVRDAILHGA